MIFGARNVPENLQCIITRALYILPVKALTQDIRSQGSIRSYKDQEQFIFFRDYPTTGYNQKLWRAVNLLVAYPKISDRMRSDLEKHQKLETQFKREGRLE